MRAVRNIVRIEEGRNGSCALVTLCVTAIVDVRIPDVSGQSFRAKPATCSEPKRPPIPEFSAIDSGQIGLSFRRFPAVYVRVVSTTAVDLS